MSTSKQFWKVPIPKYMAESMVQLYPAQKNDSIPSLLSCFSWNDNTNKIYGIGRWIITIDYYQRVIDNSLEEFYEIP